MPRIVPPCDNRAMFYRARIRLNQLISPVDLLLLVGLGSLIYALMGVAQDWAGPFRAKSEISLDTLSLIRYSFFSLVRVTAGYFISLLFTLGYGYVAAKNRLAEPVLISLLDILQSVPVLGFMPGLVLALVNLFPRSNFGLELAAIVMIFTGQGWNMVFSFYSSLKSVPHELREMTRMFHLSPWEKLRTVELPYAANGLLWNSMMSMAGGWFFLMVIESFTLGDKDFRLPGLGSYMAVAYERHDSHAVFMGITVMFLLILIVDRCVWAPLVVWSDRFKYDRDSKIAAPKSVVLNWITRSHFPYYWHQTSEAISRVVRKQRDEHIRHARERRRKSRLLGPGLLVGRWGLIVLGAVATAYGLVHMYKLVAATTWQTWLFHFRDTFYTLLRVTISTFLGALWTVPLGVWIGTHPVWTRRLQPVVQVVASFPAPMLFPVLTFVFLKLGLKLDVGSVLLLLFASQWYILFNVISGATLIPHQMLDLAGVFGVKGWHYWRSLILPAIFPSLVNGLITSAGGSWNACIVAEIVRVGDKELIARGIGATITQAAQAGDFARLGGAVLVMVSTVVLLNRLFWNRLYRLAETRFRLE